MAVTLFHKVINNNKVTIINKEDIKKSELFKVGISEKGHEIRKVKNVRK